MRRGKGYIFSLGSWVLCGVFFTRFGGLGLVFGDLVFRVYNCFFLKMGIMVGVRFVINILDGFIVCLGVGSF